ncbi:MAG: hypothetical protein AB1791_23045 [Chloroflexota bacterium]
MVPLSLLKNLGVPIVDETFVRSIFGDRRHFYIFLVDMHIGLTWLPDVEVVGDSSNHEILLGRDVINQLILLLDGPQTELVVFQRRPRAR